jgi:hypothetical protein
MSYERLFSRLEDAGYREDHDVEVMIFTEMLADFGDIEVAERETRKAMESWNSRKLQ